MPMSPFLPWNKAVSHSRRDSEVPGSKLLAEEEEESPLLFLEGRKCSLGATTLGKDGSKTFFPLAPESHPETEKRLWPGKGH